MALLGGYLLVRPVGGGGVLQGADDAAVALPELGSAEPVLASLSLEAPVPAGRALQTELDPLLSVPALGGGVSAQVVDVATGELLLDRDGDDPATPASTAKLLTAVAALTTLGPEETLETTVVAGAGPGEVVLVGGGDPTLSRTAPSQTYPGAATMADLAEQVRAALPAGTEVTRVVVDNSLFSGPLTADGWGPDDAPSSYAAPITAAAVDGARVEPGGLARSGQPGLDAGMALADALGVPGATVALGDAPVGAGALGTVASAPIARLAEQAVSQSDNVLAEALARHVALARDLPATFEGAAEAVTGAVAEAGFDTAGLELADGSGLSLRDRIPVALLADVLVGAATGAPAEISAMLSGLPVAGYDGTLAERGDEDPATAPGAVRAKTGTLLGVHALAGTVVTADGRLLVFAVIADEAPGDRAAAEAALDDVAAALARCGCR
ncbi:D-alanyl-D-alanine carboxypeptidase/D-alanyl-D-alanine endopeptidase [Geodermatophilus ruber]|uniref:D-alanyl-D-alanine carboxypeptidase/D-alanyl-D-alanine endopeptidase n=1 Tax=Geodermatophilus ruber TaxID=504800 RepID=UPI001FE1B2C3|nr:D-alanyl-D-alanine carboxypeptidase/D-alanyl-D-alanine-endopeptidase [Geodermatophilus ruber]